MRGKQAKGRNRKAATQATGENGKWSLEEEEREKDRGKGGEKAGNELDDAGSEVTDGTRT